MFRPRAACCPRRRDGRGAVETCVGRRPAAGSRPAA